MATPVPPRATAGSSLGTGVASPRAMNGLIAYMETVEQADASYPDIFTMRPDGSGRRNLTAASFFQGTPAWSPDGRRLLYLSAGSLVERSLGGRVRVLAEPTSGYWPWAPEYSPDGTKIVFCRKEITNGPSDANAATIHVSNADGSGVRKIVDQDGVRCNHPPSWSPDGKFITYDVVTGVQEPAAKHVWLVEADGENPVDLTPLEVLTSSHPEFLTNGRILFHSKRECAGAPCGEIYTMEQDGSDVRAVTVSQAHPDIAYLIAEPSPDERQLLVFQGERAPTESTTFGLVVLDLETGAATDLAETVYVGFDWQPRCTVRGTRGADVLVGTAERDLICGLGGDDVLKGLGGDDVMFGHGGNDRVIGGAGRDIVVGNSGRDRCDSDREDLSRVC